MVNKKGKLLLANKENRVVKEEREANLDKAQNLSC
jgi:hypothetical protein